MHLLCNNSSILLVFLVTAAAGLGFAPGARAAAAASSEAVVPTPIERAESQAEDVQDDLQAGRWEAADRKVETLRGLATELASTQAPPEVVSEFSASVEALARAVSSRARLPALVAANRASREITRMMARYPTHIPIEVAYMDVAARDARYGAEQGSWESASDAAAELRDRYEVVRAHVHEKAPALSTRVTESLAQLQRAIDGKQGGKVEALTGQLLEDVDAIEQTYVSSPPGARQLRVHDPGVSEARGGGSSAKAGFFGEPPVRISA